MRLVEVVIFSFLEGFLFPGYFSMPLALQLNFCGLWSLPWALSIAYSCQALPSVVFTATATVFSRRF